MQEQPQAKRFISRFIIANLDLLTICIGVVLLCLASYFFGFNIIRNPLLGNDAQNVLSYASWLNDYYPNFPYWYPLSGGGVSFVLGYPSLYAQSIVVLHRLFALNLVSSMALVNFASLVIPAIGVFAYVLFRFRLRVAAIMAGFFYLLSPISYVLISGAGFLSHAYSYIFAVPLFICFDWFLDSVFKNRKNSVRLIALLLSGVFFALTTLAHPVSSLGFMVLFVLYAALLGLIYSGPKGAVKGVGIVIVSAVVFYLMSAFWLKPFQDYTGFSNRDITFTADTSTLPPIQFQGMLGLVGKKPGNEYPFPNLSVIPFVWIMAVVGTVLGLLLFNKKAFAVGVLAFVSTILIGTYGVWIFATKINWFIGSFLVNRYYYTSFTTLLPIMAALGVWYTGSIPGYLLARATARSSKYVKATVKTFGFFVCVILAGAISVGGIIGLNQTSGWYEKTDPSMLHIGEESGISTTSIWNRPYPIEPCLYPPGHAKYNKLCDEPPFNSYFNIPTLIRFCERNADAAANEPVCKGRPEDPLISSESIILDLKYRCGQPNQPSYVYDLCLAFNMSTVAQLTDWPRLVLPAEVNTGSFVTAAFSRADHPYHFLAQPNKRIDVTPSLGSWNKEWAVANRSGTVNAYTGQLVLNKSFQSFFIDTMYSKTLVPEPSSVDQMAKYFGISGIIRTGNDQTEKFETQGWVQHSLKEGGDLWIPPFTTSLYSVETKPAILVIGSADKQAYGQFFRAAVSGAVGYDQALLFEGKDRIDDYTLAQLSKFSVLVLHGYSYHSRNESYNLLRSYLEQGGKVFVDTGWQYTAQDWGSIDGGPTRLGDPFPVERTTWGNIGNSLNGSKLDYAYSQSVDVAKFAPLVWDNQTWNLAYATTSDLSAGTVPVLQLGNKVIMAERQVGSGTIVWSGMNFISHARDNENKDELRLLGNIIKHLVGELPNTASQDASFTRSPDKLTVVLTQDAPAHTFVYFKESFYPYWKASAETATSEVDLPIYIAGPRFMAVDVSGLTKGTRVVFDFNARSALVFPKLVSILTFVVLLVLVADSLLGQHLINLVLGKLKTSKSIKGLKQTISGGEDENY